MLMEVTLSDQIEYTAELAHAVTAVWGDPGIKAVYKLSNEYQLSDSAA